MEETRTGAEDRGAVMRTVGNGGGCVSIPSREGGDEGVDKTESSAFLTHTFATVEGPPSGNEAAGGPIEDSGSSDDSERRGGEGEDVTNESAAPHDASFPCLFSECVISSSHDKEDGEGEKGSGPTSVEVGEHPSMKGVGSSDGEAMSSKRPA